MRSHYNDPDQLYSQIKDGDRECCICGNPSYTMFRGEIYCKKHNPNQPQTTEALKGTNEQIQESKIRAGIF